MKKNSKLSPLLKVLFDYLLPQWSDENIVPDHIWGFFPNALVNCQYPCTHADIKVFNDKILLSKGYNLTLKRWYLNLVWEKAGLSKVWIILRAQGRLAYIPGPWGTYLEISGHENQGTVRDRIRLVSACA